MEVEVDQLRAFLAAYPGMSIRPSRRQETVLEGRFEFAAEWEASEVKDAYDIRIEVPSYPECLPRVFEIGGRIEHSVDEHVFPNGQLCLGSDLRLRTIIGQAFDLLRFADRCIVPYLYATSRKAREGRFVFGELKHGLRGVVDDYLDLFELNERDALLAALKALASKRKSADAHTCPCRCGKRLSECGFRDRIERIRSLAHRAYFKELYMTIREYTKQ